jgi:hypothetical protein
MAPRSSPDLRDQTEFERMILARAAPLAVPDSGPAVIDLHGEDVIVGSTEAVRAMGLGITDGFGTADTINTDPQAFVRSREATQT